MDWLGFSKRTWLACNCGIEGLGFSGDFPTQKDEAKIRNFNIFRNDEALQKVTSP